MAADRLCADDLDVRLHHLEETRKTHQRPRSPDGADKVVDVAAGLLPDLQRRRLVVGQVVAGVGELVGHEIPAGSVGDFFPRQADRPVSPLLGGRQNHLRTVGADDLPPFDRHRFAHHDLHGIALDDPHDGQPDARVARCGFDDRLAGRQPSVPLGGFDHPQRNAVLDASRRIEAFEFGEYFHVRIGAQPVDPHHRGRADGPQNILFNHKSPLIKPRKDNHFPEKRLIL